MKDVNRPVAGAGDLRVNAELMSKMIHTIVLDIVQMRRIGIAWSDVQVGLKALALDRVFKSIEIEEAHHDQVVNAAWLDGYGRCLRVMTTAKGGLHGVFIDMYAEKGTLTSKEAASASKAVLGALTPIWTLLESTREVGPTLAALMVGGSSLLGEPVKRASESRLLLLDYIRWQLTDEIPSRIKDHLEHKG